ncbi:MAG: helicase [Pseudonocardiales bacterium]|nr:helicase [Pseudonocardiales bacterium]
MALAAAEPVEYPAGPPPRQFDRTPPQNIAAEQSVLGGMLLSKDAIADVVEALRPSDFYRPAHQIVCEAILDLYGRGEPADAITVSAELIRSGSIAKVGGASYLHTLMSSVPTAANAGYYAEIVAEQAILRRLVEAGTKIVQMGYNASEGQTDITGSVDDVVDRAQVEIYDVTERRSAEDYVAVSELITSTWDEIERIAANGGVGTGIPTGFAELDQITNGLHPGQMITIAGRPGSGKALSLDTPLPTPSGWTTMGSVQVGDLLLGADGRPTAVVAATEVMLGRPCFEIEFSDGSVIVADAEHQWVTQVPAGRELALVGSAARAVGSMSVGSTLTTAEIFNSVEDEQGCPRYSIACTEPLALARQSLPVPPHTLGCRLADGGEAGSNAAGHIPAAYLRASISQRRALLAGLLDTHSHPVVEPGVVFSTPFRRLAEDTLELVHSLGYRGSLTFIAGSTPVSGTSADDASSRWEVAFVPEDIAFLLTCRSARAATTDVSSLTPRAEQGRAIVDVRAIGSVPVRCVQVANSDHLYLAGRAMIPTHNSTLALDIARSSAIKNGLPTAIFSLEMGKQEIMMRLFSAEARVLLNNMRSGRMSDEDWTRMARRSGELAEAPLYIDDSPNLTMMEIRAKARRLKQRQDLKLVVIDYLQLMTSGKRVESRQQEVSEFSRAIKLLAKELEVPVIALSQLNRGSEQRTDKKPMLSDLRESGSIEQDSDVVMLVHREDMYEKESARAGEADIILAKHRNGPTGVVTVAFQGHYSRFTDMSTLG